MLINKVPYSRHHDSNHHPPPPGVLPSTTYTASPLPPRNEMGRRCLNRESIHQSVASSISWWNLNSSREPRDPAPEIGSFGGRDTLVSPSPDLKDIHGCPQALRHLTHVCRSSLTRLRWRLDSTAGIDLSMALVNTSLLVHDNMFPFKDDVLPD